MTARMAAQPEVRRHFDLASLVEIELLGTVSWLIAEGHRRTLSGP